MSHTEYGQDRIKISIIIPSYNSAKTIKFTIDNLNLDNSVILEVIIIDSSNSDELNRIKIAVGSNKKIKVIHLDKKTIPSIGRNKGGSIAKGNLLVFLDSDTYPAKDWIGKITEAYKKGYKVGGGSIELPESQKRNLLAITQYYLQFNEFLPIKSDRVKTFVPSCNFFCGRELFNKVGGFPEIRASEDVVFGINVSKLYNLWFIPNCKVFHIFGLGWKRLVLNQKLLGKYVAIYRKKNSRGLLYNNIFQIFLFPFIPLIKYSILLSRIIQSGREHIVAFLISTPVIIVGLLFWAFGYISGCYSKEPVDDK